MERTFELYFLNHDVSGSTTFYFLNSLTRFLCKNLCKKVYTHPIFLLNKI